MSGCRFAEDGGALRCISADLATRAVSAQARKLLINVASKSHQWFITTIPLLAVDTAQRVVKASKSTTAGTVRFQSKYRVIELRREKARQTLR